MTFPIRSVPDNDTAWGGEFRAAIAAANDHQTRLAVLESVPSVETVHAVGNSGASLTLNSTATGPYKTVTLTATCAFTLAGGNAGQVSRMDLELTVGGAGGFTATWTNVTWSGGTPVVSTTVGAVDVYTFWSRDGGSTWRGAPVGKGFA